MQTLSQVGTCILSRYSLCASTFCVQKYVNNKNSLKPDIYYVLLSRSDCNIDIKYFTDAGFEC